MWFDTALRPRKACAVALLLATVQTLSNGLVSGISAYPWGRTLKERSDLLLTKLRDELSLPMQQEWLPEPLASQPQSSLVFTNVDGAEFICGLEEAAKGSSRSDAIPMHFYDSQLLSSKLDSICSAMTVDYWTYEWCHQRAVSQYHIVNTKSGAERSPEWSLGHFVSSEVVRERGENSNMSAAIVSLVDRFDGGQWCDETQAPRSSEVVVQCCDGRFDATEKRGKKGAPTTTRNPNKIAYLTDISEPSVCNYRLTICSSIMCHHKISDKNSPRPVTLATVMKDLQPRCVSRQEDWWTYEICFGRSIRQFRVQPVPEEAKGGAGALSVDANGASDASLEEAIAAAKQAGNKEETLRLAGELARSKAEGGAGAKQSAKMVMKVVSEFSLGVLSSNIDIDEGQMYDRVVHRQEGMAVDLTGKKKNNSVATFGLDYGNGTACDLKDTMRSARVELSCGVALGFKSIEIMDIVEDSTCHYLFKVSVPGLCLLDAFAPKKRKTSVLDCLPMEEMTSLFDGPSEENDNVYNIGNENAEFKDPSAEEAITGTSEADSLLEAEMKPDGSVEDVIRGKGSPREEAADSSDATMQRFARTSNHNHIKFEKKRKDKEGGSENIVE